MTYDDDPSDHYDDNVATLAEQIAAYPAQVAFAALEDGKECQCRECGWILTPYDSWEPCPVHFANQRHPEAYPYDEEDELPPRPPLLPEPPAEIEIDDCPF